MKFCVSLALTKNNLMLKNMCPEKIYPLFLHKIESQVETQILKELIISDPQKFSQKYRVIISFDDVLKRDNFLTEHDNLETLKQFDLIPAISLYLTKQEIEDFKENEHIKRIEEDQNLYLSLLEVNEIIGLSKYRKSVSSKNGKGIIISIIDNGINKNNEKEITHGTLMANIITNYYVDDNYIPIGIAPDAELIDLDISNTEESYFFSDVLEKFDLIINNSMSIDILLISLTTLHPSDGQDILSIACNLLTNKGLIIVCPAGNFGPESYTIGSPSAAENVITIGSLTKDMTIAYYSGRGPTLDERTKPDFCLPGSKIEIPLSKDQRITFSGTSAAAAIGAGIIALIKESNPHLSHNSILEIIKNSSINLNYQTISQGYGTTNIIRIFKQLETQQKKETLPYTYLVKRSLWVTIELISILIGLFYLIYFFNLMRIFYNWIN